MNYREKRGAYLNCEKLIFDGCDDLGTPAIAPEDIDISGAEVVGFNYAIGCRNPENKIVHFFLDDYQFERVWNDPDRYIPVLRKFRAVIAPDFSMYTDFPKVVQMFNHYRKHWCAAYWQERGIKVIPAIGWSDEDSFKWCFNGEPENATLCFSTVGGFRSKATKEAWLAGYKEAIKRLHPSRVILFGKAFPEIEFDGDLQVASNSNLDNKATLSAKSVNAALDKTPQPVL